MLNTIPVGAYYYYYYYYYNYCYCYCYYYYYDLHCIIMKFY